VSAGKRVLTQKLNGDFTFNGRTERLLKRFDALTGKQIGSVLPLQTGAVDIAFSPDGRQIALGEHEFALILNSETLAPERRLNVLPTPTAGLIQAPVCVSWSPDSATLATSTSRGLMLWRMR
jgi:WD40 repeat protein